MEPRKRKPIDLQRAEALSRLLRKKKVSKYTVSLELDISMDTLNNRFRDFETFRIHELRTMARLCDITLPTLITYIDLPSRELNKKDTGYRWMDDNDALRAKLKIAEQELQTIKKSIKGHMNKRGRYMRKDGDIKRWKTEFDEIVS